MNGQWLGSRAIRANWATRKPNPPVENKCKYSVTNYIIAICCCFMCVSVCVCVCWCRVVCTLLHSTPFSPTPFSPTLLLMSRPSVELT